MISVALFPVSLLLAFCVGFAVRRGGVCALSGVEDLASGRGPAMFLSFLKASGWVVLVTVPLSWIWPTVTLAPAMAPSLLALTGGMLYGVGAAINGACAFATLSRLGSGDISFSLTLVGMAAGYVAQAAIVGTVAHPPPLQSPLAGPEPWVLALLLGVAALLAAELVRLWRVDGFGRGRARDGSGGKTGWDKGASMLVIGTGAGLLYAIHGAWMYTATLHDLVSGFPLAEEAWRLALLAAVLAGAAFSSRAKGIWRTTKRSPSVWAAHLGGGMLMGFGALLVPGGNDVLVLQAIPGLSPHAIPTYLAMCGGMALVLLIRREAKGVRVHLVGRRRRRGTRTLQPGE
ncbi:MAG TPA: YeeE/YedE thiosulfate transporter family protein [Azospirillaceae bacterium]|nr:YeeE/YedE thiosulfate transporter family protein [Azospirillaceae bacterium]